MLVLVEVEVVVEVLVEVVVVEVVVEVVEVEVVEDVVVEVAVNQGRWFRSKLYHTQIWDTFCFQIQQQDGARKSHCLSHFLVLIL